jgi:outer membrane protein TolC
VYAQSARIGVATADLYPRFSLTGNFTLDSTDFTSLFEGASVAYRAVPALRWNILNFGRVRSNIQVQDARWEQALQRYRQAVLVAVEEVENALSAHLRSQQAERELVEAETAAKRAAQVAGEQYRGGVTSFQSLLDAERFLAEVQDRHLEAQGNVALSAVALYKALGGGWNWQATGLATGVAGEGVPQPAPAPAPEPMPQPAPPQ